MQNDPEIQQILRLLSDVENLTHTEQEHLLKLGTKKYVQHRLKKGASGEDILRELEAMADASDIAVGIEPGRARVPVLQPQRKINSFPTEGKNMKKTEGVAKTGSAEFEKAFTFFADQGHPNPEKAIEKLSQYWFRDCVILDDEEFSEELLYLRYYRELTNKPITEAVREALEDWLECSYATDVHRIEEERGLPSTMVFDRKRKVKA
jgi:hypothetical protein